MPSDHAGTHGGYLAGVLAQGAAPFAHRSRVHRLLGAAPPAERRVSFARPFPPVGFQYAAHSLGTLPAAPPPLLLPTPGRWSDASPARAAAHRDPPAATRPSTPPDPSRAAVEMDDEQAAALAAVRASMRALAVPPRPAAPVFRADDPAPPPPAVGAPEPRRPRAAAESERGSAEPRDTARTAPPAARFSIPGVSREREVFAALSRHMATEPARRGADGAGEGADRPPPPVQAGKTPPLPQPARRSGPGIVTTEAGMGMEADGADRPDPPMPAVRLSVPGVTRDRDVFAALSRRMAVEEAQGRARPVTPRASAGVVPGPAAARSAQTAASSDAGPRLRARGRSGEREVAQLRSAVATLAAREAILRAPPEAPPPPPPRAPERVVVVRQTVEVAGAAPRGLGSRGTLRGMHLRPLR